MIPWSGLLNPPLGRGAPPEVGAAHEVPVPEAGRLPARALPPLHVADVETRAEPPLRHVRARGPPRGPLRAGQTRGGG